MANSLGSLSSFEHAPEQPEVTGMRHAGTLIPVEPTSPPPVVGPGHGAELAAKKPGRPPLVRLTAATIAELMADTEKALARLEKHGKKEPLPELETQIKSELLSMLLSEFVALKREEARGILAGLYAPRWRRQITRLELDRFEIVVAARSLLNELVTVREKDFASVARRIFEHLRANWRNRFLPSLVCLGEIR